MRAGVETASQTRIEGAMQQQPQPTAVLPHHGGGKVKEGENETQKAVEGERKQYNLTMKKKNNWNEKKSCQIERRCAGNPQLSHY
jgi:hypothetical protein